MKNSTDYLFDEVWNSWEWIIKEDLTRMDQRVRKVWKEARCAGVKQEHLETELYNRFWTLWRDVIKEANQREA